MIKVNVICIVCFMILFFSGVCFAIPPKKIIKSRNLEARVIVIGKIERVNSSLPTPFFDLKVLHVVKGYETLKEGEIIKVCFKGEEPAKGGIKAHTMGELLVKVETGQMVICYLNPSSKPGCYKPLMEGLSVIPLEP